MKALIAKTLAKELRIKSLLYRAGNVVHVNKAQPLKPYLFSILCNEIGAKLYTQFYTHLLAFIEGTFQADGIKKNKSSEHF